MLCFVEPAGTVIGAVVPFSRVVISAGNADFLRYSNQFIFLTDWAGASSDGSYSIGSGVMDFRKISASDEDLQVFRRRERGLTQKNLVNEGLRHFSLWITVYLICSQRNRTVQES